jgi:DNA-directed RNA polymerase subunit RPC12/RpoP
MACKPCEAEAKRKAKAEAKVEEIPSTMLSIECYCGLRRLLPPGLKQGDNVHLDPCPKCGHAFNGLMVEGGIQT